MPRRTPATWETLRAWERVQLAVTLNEGGITCRTLTVAVATDDFRADGNVTATVSCAVELLDVSGLRVPATRTISGSHTEPIDHYRGAPL